MQAKKKGYAAGGKLKKYAGGGSAQQQRAPDTKQQKTPVLPKMQEQPPQRKMKSGGKLKKYASGGKMKGMDSPGEGVTEAAQQLLKHGDSDRTTSLERMSEDMGTKKKVPLPPKRPKKMATGGRVKKMGLGGILGSISPVAGAITGKGLYGDAAKAISKGVKSIKKSDVAPLLGVGAGLALNELGKKDKPKSTAVAAGKATAMKRGGPMHKMPNGKMMKGKVHKMKHGGAMCRGMGAATRGGNFKIG